MSLTVLPNGAMIKGLSKAPRWAGEVGTLISYRAEQGYDWNSNIMTSYPSGFRSSISFMHWALLILVESDEMIEREIYRVRSRRRALGVGQKKCQQRHVSHGWTQPVQLNQRLLSTDYALDTCEQKSQWDVVPALEKFTWELENGHLSIISEKRLWHSYLCYAGYTAFVKRHLLRNISALGMSPVPIGSVLLTLLHLQAFLQMPGRCAYAIPQPHLFGKRLVTSLHSTNQSSVAEDLNWGYKEWAILLLEAWLLLSGLCPDCLSSYSFSCTLTAS